MKIVSVNSFKEQLKQHIDKMKIRFKQIQFFAYLKYKLYM